MNECEKYEALISALVDSELSEEEKSALAQHLQVCPSCRCMYESFKALSDSLSGGLEELPEGLHENIMAQIRREDIKKKNKRRLPKPLKTLIAAAACVAIIVGIGLGSAGDIIMDRTAASAPAVPFEAAPEAESFAASDGESNAETAEEDGISLASAPQIMSLEPEDEEAEKLPSTRKAFTSAAPAAGEAEDGSLSPEAYEELISMLAGTVFEGEAEPSEGADISESIFCSDGRSLNLYLCGDILYYKVSSSESVYTSGCSFSDISDFLNQNR